MNKLRTLLYPQLKIERRPPINLEGGSSGFIEQVKLEFDAVYLFEYSKANVTPEGNVFKNLSLDKDLLIYPGHKKIYNLVYLCSTFIKRKKIRLPAAEKYLVCFDYWSNSIFHWMCDALPRLEAVKELAKNCIFILPDFYEYSYIHETLKAFCFKDIYFIKDNSYVHCEKLYVPQQITISGQMRPENIKNLRRTLLDYFIPKFTGRLNHPNIYVSREKAKHRKVLNENELGPVLAQHHFKLIYLEDFTVAEQVELCYNARNLVSIHGANLTNIIFMQENGNVAELRKKEDLYNNYFYELADSVKCRYFHLDCEYEDPVQNKNFFNLYVDPVKFDMALKKITHVA